MLVTSPQLSQAIPDAGVLIKDNSGDFKINLSFGNTTLNNIHGKKLKPNGVMKRKSPSPSPL